MTAILLYQEALQRDEGVSAGTNKVSCLGRPQWEAFSEHCGGGGQSRHLPETPVRSPDSAFHECVSTRPRARDQRGWWRETAAQASALTQQPRIRIQNGAFTGNVYVTFIYIRSKPGRPDAATAPTAERGTEMLRGRQCSPASAPHLTLVLQERHGRDQLQLFYAQEARGRPCSPALWS